MIVCYRLDRLSRSVSDFTNLYNELINQYGQEFIDLVITKDKEKVSELAVAIAKGMHDALLGKSNAEFNIEFDATESAAEVNYDLFTTDSPLEFGYCTECLVRLQRAKGNPSGFDEKVFADALEKNSAFILEENSKDIINI